MVSLDLNIVLAVDVGDRPELVSGQFSHQAEVAIVKVLGQQVLAVSVQSVVAAVKGVEVLGARDETERCKNLLVKFLIWFKTYIIGLIFLLQ